MHQIMWSCGHLSMPFPPPSHVAYAYLNHTWYNSISNLVSLITKTKLRLSPSGSLPFSGEKPSNQCTSRLEHGSGCPVWCSEAPGCRSLLCHSPLTIPYFVGTERLLNPLVGPDYELRALGQTVCIWSSMTYAKCMYEAWMMRAHDACAWYSYTYNIIRELLREKSVHRSF
jgi:hypothetical protein